MSLVDLVMIVPNHWAEAHTQNLIRGRRVVVQRFGWSERSEAEAQAMASARAAQAMDDLLAGRVTARRERKVAYNGTEGVPIREEVVARHGDVVVTRNGYGARCLNTPDIVFADVDLARGGSTGARLAVIAVLAALALFAAWQIGSRTVTLVLVLGMWPLVSWVWNARFRDARHPAGKRTPVGVDAELRRRIDAFLAQHPHWNVRVYRTPAGWRLLATHAPLPPTADEVCAFFKAVGVDPMYSRLCLNQHCYRARLTAKPWRIGMTRRMGPRPGVWPVAEERRAARTAWIAEYERKAAAFASCSFLENLGSGITHPKAVAVIDVHDRECRALVPQAPLA